MSKNPDYVLNYLTADLPSQDEKPPEWWNEYNDDKNKGQRLTKIRFIGKGMTLYKCLCGNTHIARARDVNFGSIKSCGCSYRNSEYVERKRKRENQARYRNKHRDRCIASVRAYYNANKERINQARREKRKNDSRSNGICQHTT